jgi:PEGA domain
LQWKAASDAEAVSVAHLEETRMRREVSGVRLLAALGMTALVALAVPGSAEARGHGHGHFGGPFVVGGFVATPFVGGGFWGPGFWGGGFWGPAYAYGYGYGPYWGPFAYAPKGGIDRNYARLMGWGAVDLHVKPGKAEVWVDGHYVGKASDFDGSPSYLWMNKGSHKVVVYSGGYVTFEQQYEIGPGDVHELHLKMEKGESVPPKSAPERKDKRKSADESTTFETL